MIETSLVTHDTMCKERGPLFVCTRYKYPVSWWGTMDCCGRADYVACSIVPHRGDVVSEMQRLCVDCYLKDFVVCNAAGEVKNSSGTGTIYFVHNKRGNKCKGAHTRKE